MITKLYEAAPSIGKFQNTTFVIKLGGEVLSSASRLASLSKQLLVLWQIGIRPVVVHGAGPQLDQALRDAGHEPRKVAGRRVTDEKTLELAKRTFRGAANLDLTVALNRAGVPAIGLSGADAGLLALKRRPPVDVDGESVDFGYVGDPVNVNPAVLNTLIAARFVPVVCSLGADDKGQVLNVNADTVACELAAGLKAEKLMFVTDKPGILHNVDDQASIYSVLDIADIERLTAEGVIQGGMAPKATAGVSALKRGVRRVHIIGIGESDALLEETFTNQGCGTMLVEDRSTVETL